jgi:hypothetical protein
MISSEVQRTLVKSPPELWAELSDPSALSRHLGELGEIRITRTEHEKTVEWQAGQTSGVVSLKPSGWGTKVTLAVNQETPEVEPTLEQAPEPPTPEAEPLALLEPPPLPEPEPEPEPLSELAVTEVCEESLELQAELKPRRGFLARLFGRRKEKEVDPESAEVIDTAQTFTDQPPDIEPENELSPQAQEIDEPLTSALTEPCNDAVADISAELAAAEQVATEQVTALLTSVLDRLGAAHHRPFSRS